MWHMYFWLFKEDMQDMNLVLSAVNILGDNRVYRNVIESYSTEIISLPW